MLSEPCDGKRREFDVAFQMHFLIDVTGNSDVSLENRIEIIEKTKHFVSLLFLNKPGHHFHSQLLEERDSFFCQAPSSAGDAIESFSNFCNLLLCAII